MSNRLLLSLALAASLVAVAPVRVHAALLWTLVATPLAVVTGTTTDFSLTATSLDVTSRIRCIEVEVPRSFDVLSATAASGWTAVIGGSSGNRVEISSSAGIGGLLNPLSTTFSIRARALSAGELTWAAEAYSRSDCGGSGSLLGVPPIVLVTGPAVTATPVPTPVLTPTPRPTPRPTPTPTPAPLLPLPSLPLPSVALPSPLLPLPLPTPLPDIVPTPPSVDPNGPTPAPTPASRGDMSPVPGDDGSARTPAPSSSEQSTAGGAVPPQEGPGAASPTRAQRLSTDPAANAPHVVFDPARMELAIGPLGLFGSASVWIVPAATIGVPGLLILAWVVLQAAGVAAWIPAVRRLRGEEPDQLRV